MERSDRRHAEQARSNLEVPAERIVVTGEQDPLAAFSGPARPRRGKPGLARSGATGHHHPAVHVERLEGLHLPFAQLVEPQTQEPGSSFGIEANSADGQSLSTIARNPKRRPGTVQCRSASQTIDRIERILQVGSEQDLMAVDVGWQLTPRSSPAFGKITP
jgi:hypothetical protein